jgi:predicted cupin superfamily sugar epimerase
MTAIEGATAEEIVAVLGLVPHPEGGFYRETWRHVDPGGGRGAGTAIYFLLVEGVENRWHRVDATEIWHHYAGAPVELTLAHDGKATTIELLGPELLVGQVPQHIVPAGAWQRAATLGAWSLVGCTVSPAFEFERFEIAPEGFDPG